MKRRRTRSVKPQPPRPARRLTVPGWLWLRGYGLRHAQTALFSLGRMYRTPIASLMTAAVIGIAFAMPAGLYLLVGNLQQLGKNWDGSASLSLFLQQEVSNAEAQALADRLQQWPEIDTITLITPQQALEEFRNLSGFGDALELLEHNPLPGLLTVQPGAEHGDPNTAARLLERLKQLPEVELAQLDLQWVKRFSAMMEIAQRGILVVGALLAIAVLLTVGNTIRLDIYNRREEIEVSKLIGATNGFIRRPFLYAGLWYGLIGAILAWLLVEIAFWQLRAPVRELAGLYQSQYRLSTFGFGDSLSLFCIGMLLGLAGAWLAVGRHLSAIEPA